MSFNDLFSTDEALLNLRIATRNAIAAREKTQNEYTKAENELTKWNRRYQLALDADKNDLIEAAKFQIERFETIISKLKSLILNQNTQVETMKLQEKYWKEKLVYKQNNDVNKIATSKEASLEANPVFSKKLFETFFDEIDLIIEIITQKLSNKLDEFIGLEEIKEFIKRLEKELLIKEKMIAEFDFRLVSYQIEYYQVLKEAKIWKARAREVSKWDVDEITEQVNAQFQSLKYIAIELKKSIKETEENIIKAKNLIDQYRQKLNTLDERYSKLFQESSSIEEPQEYDDSIDAELESLKTKLDSL